MTQSDAGEIAVQGDHERDEDSVAVALSGEDIRKLLMTELTVSPVIAGRAFGLGRNASYNACQPGGLLPALRTGPGKLAVPTAPLRRMLGIDSSPSAVPQTVLPNLTETKLSIEASDEASPPRVSAGAEIRIP